MKNVKILILAFLLLGIQNLSAQKKRCRTEAVLFRDVDVMNFCEIARRKIIYKSYQYLYSIEDQDYVFGKTPSLVAYKDQKLKYPFTVIEISNLGKSYRKIKRKTSDTMIAVPFNIKTAIHNDSCNLTVNYMNKTICLHLTHNDSIFFSYDYIYELMSKYDENYEYDDQRYKWWSSFNTAYLDFCKYRQISILTKNSSKIIGEKEFKGFAQVILFDNKKLLKWRHRNCYKKRASNSTIDSLYHLSFYNVTDSVKRLQVLFHWKTLKILGTTIFRQKPTIGLGIPSKEKTKLSYKYLYNDSILWYESLIRFKAKKPLKMFPKAEQTFFENILWFCYTANSYEQSARNFFSPVIEYLHEAYYID